MVILPPIQILTSDSRSILSDQVTLKQMIAQTGNAATLVAALYSSDFNKISRCLQDVIIEPQRSHLIPKFDKADSKSMLIGTSQLAEVRQNGEKETEVLRFPFVLMFVPSSPSHNKVPCSFNDFTSQLLDESHFYNGTVLYDIHAVDAPWSDRPNGRPSMSKIGEVVLQSNFVKSTFGDTRLFFRHKFFHEEIESVADPKEREIWQKYVDNVEFGKTEGAMLYAPFL